MTTSSPIDATAVAAEAAAAIAEARAVAPFSERLGPIALEDGYRIAAALRTARGGKLVGRKIGFTNRALWETFKVDAPIWGDVTDATLLDVDALGGGLALAPFNEPRIEPEIALGILRAPSPGMDETALASCIAWVAPAFEIVQSIFPGWRFTAGDAVASGALHGRLVVGPITPIEEISLDQLPTASVRLMKDGAAIETGVGANALGGPMTALKHLVGLLDADPHNPPLSPGEVVTTGTLTDAYQIAPGQTWRAEFDGAPLEPIELRFL